jgi:hypothetical protein
MADRRMFTKSIIDSDAFLDMPLSAQALYFHLAMRADDDGFLNNAKKVMKIVGANQNDYDFLVIKRFVLVFEDGICVIKHWRMHNYIQKDRYKETVYQEHLQKLIVKDNKAYTLDNTLDTDCIQDVYSLDTMDTQVRLGKDSIGKDSYSMSANADLQPIKDYWNSKSLLAEITTITDKRKIALNSRIKEHGLDAIYKAIDNVGKSKFMRGGNDKNWYASFDWVFAPNNFVKVLEGNYVDKEKDVEDMNARVEKVKRELGL